MIILDTNVISELMKNIPAIAVMQWLDQQDITNLFITTITVAEISYGISVLPKGKFRYALEGAFDKAVHESFRHRILAFDEPSSYLYGKLMGERKALGRPLSILDGQIAAIACAHNATIATRNIRDFSHCNLELVNPFKN